VPVKEMGATFHQYRVTREWPDIHQCAAESVTQQIGNEITEECTDGCSYPHRHHVEHTQADQGADPKQDEHAGQQDTDQHQRFEQGYQ
jgi:hypothetical protein